VSASRITYSPTTCDCESGQSCRKPIARVTGLGISDQTIYLWRKKFGQLEPADVKRLGQLEQENAKLKKLVAERDLEMEVMKEIAAKKW